ncbi:MAG TPA: hypothetical protein DEH78_11115 [Solibacterales bacterium]|nr:hypothetical protein [Bryobacterales bacterium]
MGFLDNLESNLDALERSVERDPEEAKRAAEQREARRAEALQIAPWAEALRKGPFTEKLLVASRAIGFGARILVQFTWLDTTLRLDAKEKRLELRPAPNGVRAVYFENGAEERSEMLDLSGDAEAFAKRWLLGG